MSSSASLKDLSKAINAFIVAPVTPLPDDLVEVIAAYLRRHQKYDEAASDRLQEELLAIYDKHVKHTSNVAARSAWIGLLRHLLPVLQTPERILQWFDVMQGVLESSSHERGMVDETMSGLMALVTFSDEYRDVDDESVGANPVVERIFAIWMDRYYPAFSQGRIGMDHNERLIRDALSQYGKRRPKEFFTTLNSYFLQSKYRRPVLRFFCDFIQNQPPHLHQILQTPLFANLLTCLQQDTSTTIVSAALTGLIMLLPHVCSSLVPHLPTLFNIYARLLFWHRERSGALEAPTNDSEQAKGWDTCSYEPEVEDLVIPHLPKYFTFLYGLYPLNFMDYIRKPQRYLRHANAVDADEIGVQPTEIRDRSEPYRRCHLLHPNFYTMTIESEKTDFGRWIKAEAAEVAADCLNLYVAPETDHSDAIHGMASPVHVAGDAEHDAADSALLSGSLTKVESLRSEMAKSFSTADKHRESVSSHPSMDTKGRDFDIDSSHVASHLTHSPSQSQLQDLIQSNKAIKSSLNQSLNNDSVPSLALSNQDSAAEKTPGAQTQLHSPELSTQISHLQRQILLLQNDLSFERYQKQQHMAHIGDLRRKQLAEAASEAEAQNLVMLNRSLKSRYEEAKKAEMQVRKESEKSRAMAKKWEADFSNKIKTLRDESRRGAVDFDALKRELDSARAESEKLRRMVCDVEVRELNAEQNRKMSEVESAEAEKLRAEVERLTVLERDFQAKEREHEAAALAAEQAANELEGLKMKVAAAQSDVQRTRTLFQSQIATLQTKLADAQEEHSGRGGSGAATNMKIEEAISASRAKQAEMQRQHDLLLRKYTALQSSLLDMQSGANPGSFGSAFGSPRAAETSGEGYARSASPVTVRRPYGTADDGLSYNATPPLEMWPSASGSGSGTGDGVGVGVGLQQKVSVSPEQRFHGRGGIQTRLRKDSKDKQREDSPARPGSEKRDKKEKKPLKTIGGLYVRHY